MYKCFFCSQNWYANEIFVSKFKKITVVRDIWHTVVLNPMHSLFDLFKLNTKNMHKTITVMAKSDASNIYMFQ